MNKTADKPLTETDFRYMSIPAILATEKEKVQSAKRLLKQNQVFISQDILSILSKHLELEEYCMVSALLGDLLNEPDACFRISDEKE